MDKLSDLLKQYRTSNGLSQQELSDRIGITQSYLSTIEAGIKTALSRRTLAKIRNATGIEIVRGDKGQIVGANAIQVPIAILKFREEFPREFESELNRFLSRIYARLGEDDPAGQA